MGVTSAAFPVVHNHVLEVVPGRALADVKGNAPILAPQLVAVIAVGAVITLVTELALVDAHVANMLNVHIYI